MEFWRMLSVQLLLLLGFFLGGFWVEGCLEHEKIALLQLKPFFSDGTEGFENWGKGGKEFENCCQWERVECSSTYGRVIQLFLNLTATITSLDYADEVYNEFQSFGREAWHLNASLFLPFEELESLYLNGNSIAGCVHDHGFEKLSSKLDKLRILNLNGNNFDNSILQSLSELSSLKSLYLGENLFTKSNTVKGIKWLSKLKNLEILDLHGNYYVGNSILSHLYGFTSLKAIYLQECGIKGTIHMSEFNNLVNLKELYLGENEIENVSFGEGELKLNKLEVLGLSDNLVDNSIFESFAELRNLKSLYLSGNKLKGAIDIKVLNALSNLKELYMGENEVSDFVSSQDDETNLEWANLEVLDLWLNPFNNNILSFLSNFSNLKVLFFGGDELKGPIDLKELSALSHLEDLYIGCSYDYFGSPTTSQDTNCSLSLESLFLFPLLKTLELEGFSFTGTINYKEMQNFTNLEELTLRYSFLQSNFIGGFTSLRLLEFRNCVINYGNLTTSTQGFCDLKFLQELDISNNNLKGILPECFSNLTSLKRLDLSYNEFSGNIYALENLTSLQELRLSNNSFEIPSSLGPLYNLSKLKSIYADYNNVYSETQMHLLTPTFQLIEIRISCCGEGGSFPEFLYHQHDLQMVDLSNIHFKEEQFPDWLLKNNSNLYFLYLSNMSLSGPFHLQFASHLKLQYLDVSQNFFNTSIPIKIGKQLPSLELLSMSKNHLRGSIPSSFGEMRSLLYLYLSGNQLTGGIPQQLTLDCSSLKVLALSNNTLQGQLFLGEFNLTNLNELRLDGNNFSGWIPNVLSTCSYLYTLDLSNNNLSGGIPSWIWNMSSLTTLDVSNNRLYGKIPQWRGRVSSLKQIAMANNHLQGRIPEEFCNINLQFLDLSGNNITGSLPSCFNLSQISEVHLSRNKLRGPFPNAFHGSSLMVILDLSYNNFTGNIPKWINKLSQLSYLLLKGNNFEGEIPNELCELAHTSLIDISHNNLSGGIPHCLKVIALNNVSDRYIDSFFKSLQRNCSTSIEESIEYTVKRNSYAYKRRSLIYMSGIDLSCNKLTGEIPREIGNFLTIITLNLSHNNFTGPIPQVYSTLVKIENLDLSYNKLSGNIPPELVKLNFLSTFNVSYNNLSGKTPEMIAQFATFDESSYLGNPSLCGPPLQKSCLPTEPSTKASYGIEEKDGFIDMEVFYVSFVVTYIIVLLTIAAVFCINPYWRRVWFYRVEMGYYFVIDNFPRRFL